MNTPETEHDIIIVDKLETLVYGDEKATISTEKYQQSAEYDAEIDARFWEIIDKGDAVVVVQESDDGCIDGRWTVRIAVDEDGTVRWQNLEDNRNHERAKVAGGGYLTSLVMRLGAGIKGSTADEDLSQTGEILGEKGIVCGAHTASHTHGEGSTGCLANDGLALILHNGIAYKDGVADTTKKLLAVAGLEFDETIFEKVLTNWEAALSDEAYFKGSTGETRLLRILNTQAQENAKKGGRKPSAVTKELGGEHKELAIGANFVEGTTISQGVIAKTLIEEFKNKREDFNPENLPQIFVIDAWRIVQLAENAVDEAAKLEALYAGVMYQAATAATLTDGTLPVRTYTKK